MLRKIFGPNTEEGIGDLRKLHNEDQVLRLPIKYPK
jgi:hypothetical protein